MRLDVKVTGAIYEASQQGLDEHCLHCSTGPGTAPLFLPYFNLDSTLTENASIIATSLPAKTGCVPLLYVETRGTRKPCVCERMGGG